MERGARRTSLRTDLLRRQGDDVGPRKPTRFQLPRELRYNIPATRRGRTSQGLRKSRFETFRRPFSLGHIWPAKPRFKPRCVRYTWFIFSVSARYHWDPHPTRWVRIPFSPPKARSSEPSSFRRVFRQPLTPWAFAFRLESPALLLKGPSTSLRIGLRRSGCNPCSDILTDARAAHHARYPPL